MKHFKWAIMILLISSCGQVGVFDLNPDEYSNGSNVPTGGSGSISFAAQITPILNSKCGVVCHKPGGTSPGLNLNVTGSGLYNAVQPLASTLLNTSSTSHPAGSGIFLTANEQTAYLTWASEGALNN